LSFDGCCYVLKKYQIIGHIHKVIIDVAAVNSKITETILGLAPRFFGETLTFLTLESPKVFPSTAQLSLITERNQV